VTFDGTPVSSARDVCNKKVEKSCFSHNILSARQQLMWD
jgi:hypothetical protein